MSFKKINKLLFLFLLIFIASCSTLNKSNEKNITKIDNDSYDYKNKIEYVKLNNKFTYRDYYNMKNNYVWVNQKNIVKIKTLKSFINKNSDFNTLFTFIHDNKIYSFTDETKITIFNLTTFKKEDFIEIQTNIDNYLVFPTSLAFYDNIIYLAYSNGMILSVNLDGEILWKKQYNDLLKTPIKIFNSNLIVILSDSIKSLNLENGYENWNFSYKNKNTLQSSGGSIVELNHLLFSILPNGRTSEIDTFFGEKNTSIFSNFFNQEIINNNFDSIHTYKSFLSYFDQNTYLTTLDIKNNKIIVDHAIIENVISHKFYNNVLFTIHPNNILKAFNITNKKLFWQTNLHKKISKNDKIINLIITEKIVVLFFKSGSILELMINDGNFVNQQNIKLKNINSIYFDYDYIFITQDNGKSNIYKQ